MKKEYLVNLAGILFFYSLIVIGVIALNARFEHINNSENYVSFVR